MIQLNNATTDGERSAIIANYIRDHIQHLAPVVTQTFILSKKYLREARTYFIRNPFTNDYDSYLPIGSKCTDSALLGTYDDHVHKFRSQTFNASLLYEEYGIDNAEEDTELFVQEM